MRLKNRVDDWTNETRKHGENRIEMMEKEYETEKRKKNKT